jgi:phosphoheptose isomerase
MVKSTCSSARQYLDALVSLLPRIDAAAIDRVTDAVFRRWVDDRQVLILGNGGSASTAAHYVTDLVKTAWVPGQRRLRALSMTDNPGLTTAVGNDISYEETFSFPLESYARPGDLVVAISGSGNSPNIVSACKLARSRTCRSHRLRWWRTGSVVGHSRESTQRQLRPHRGPPSFSRAHDRSGAPSSRRQPPRRRDQLSARQPSEASFEKG